MCVGDGAVDGALCPDVVLVVCTVGVGVDGVLPCATAVVVVGGVAPVPVDVEVDVIVGGVEDGGEAGAGGVGSGVDSGGGDAAAALFAVCACAMFGSFLRTAVLMMRTTPTTPAASEMPRNAALM